jgi:hypothetical protein
MTGSSRCWRRMMCQLSNRAEQRETEGAILRLSNCQCRRLDRFHWLWPNVAHSLEIGGSALLGRYVALPGIAPNICTIEPLVMYRSETSVAAANLGNVKDLVSITHNELESAVKCRISTAQLKS